MAHLLVRAAGWRGEAARRREDPAHSDRPPLSTGGYIAGRAVLAAQASRLRRRRAKPIRPPQAAIRPGRPAPTIGPGTALSDPNRTCDTSFNPTVVVNATREISSPPAVVKVKKFCPPPLRGSEKLNRVPNWSKALMLAEPLAVASRLKTA